MITIRYEPLTVGAADAGKITGLSPVMQRDWRRRGILPSPTAAEARHDVIALGTMMFLTAMAHRVGPGKALEVADIAGPAIAFYALQSEEAWEDGTLSPGGIFHEALAAVRDLAPLGSPLRSGVIPARLMIWWADGSEMWHESVDHAVAALTDAEVEAKLGGPVVVLDQAMMGALLVRRAGRPLLRASRVEA